MFMSNLFLKKELINKIKSLSTRIGHFQIYLNEYHDEGLAIGYFFDEQRLLWSSYYVDGTKMRVDSSPDEIKILESVYNMVCKEVEAHTDTLKKIKKIIPELIFVPVYLNEYYNSQYAIGYYYDLNDKYWKVYRNGERNDSFICHSYEYPEEAIVRVYKMVRVEYNLQHQD